LKEEHTAAGWWLYHSLKRHVHHVFLSQLLTNAGPHSFHTIVKYIYYADKDESHDVENENFWPLLSTTKSLGIAKLKQELIQNTCTYTHTARIHVIL
jgi:hypothetical protein